MKILLTGGTGMLGRAILRLAPAIFPDAEILAPTRQEMNLMDRISVRRYLSSHKFDGIIHAGAKVGGIKANIEDPVGFMSENMLMSFHMIEEARQHNIPRLINIGSSCMYPRNFEGLLTEEAILSAPLEPTNEGYAIAKIAASRLCSYISEKQGYAYRTFIPCNLYGPHDRFDLQHGHMIAAAIVKIHAAHQNGDADVEIWGDGLARREFVYVDDVARFILDSIQRLESLPQDLNLGLGHDLTVMEYYQEIAEVIGFRGRFFYNRNAPVGMSHKLMDITKATSFGWEASMPLSDGLKESYSSFLRIFAN